MDWKTRWQLLKDWYLRTDAALDARLDPIVDSNWTLFLFGLVLAGWVFWAWCMLAHAGR